MRCEVCAAPALSLGGACAFCRSPLPGAGSDSEGLLEYLAERLPMAEVRHGVVGRGPVSAVLVAWEGEDYRARRRSEGLELVPDVEEPLWVDALLEALSRRAAVDPDVRDAVLRSGWALR